ncbi:MAG: WbqC family protein [Phycisphaerales bacterium]|nr:WbqC family protein [Phycisphaerales bacterium]
MIVSIHQPAYLPWLGYCARIARSHRHIVLDHVQFEKNSYINRNRVRTASGPCWLTVPVKTSGRFGELPINKVEIDNTRDWRRKHWQTLTQAYSQAPHFADHADFFENVYRRDWTHLALLCETTTAYLLAALGIDTQRKASSAMNASGVKEELVLNLCREAGATTYFSGSLGRDYLCCKTFADSGMRVEFQDYRHPKYPQVGEGFIANLSVVDLLFNCGPASLDVLMIAGTAVSR